MGEKPIPLHLAVWQGNVEPGCIFYSLWSGLSGEELATRQGQRLQLMEKRYYYVIFGGVNGSMETQ